MIGNDPEAQLAPFDENKRVPTYVSGSVSEEEKQRFIDYYVNKNESLKGKTFDEIYRLHGKNWNNNCWVTRDGVLVEISTYNPQSKWDWYQLGGRWMGFFKLKEGKQSMLGKPGVFHNEAESGYVDQALKGDIDFDGQRAIVRAEATEVADRVFSSLQKLPALIRWDDITKEQIDSVVIRRKKGEKKEEITDNHKRREFYHNQPRAKLLRKLFPEHTFLNYLNYECTREEYIERKVNGTYSTYAVLKDGKWYQHGKMGWFGISHNEMTDDEWYAEFAKLIDSIPDGTLLSVYDCHI